MTAYEVVGLDHPFPPDYCKLCGAVVIDKEAHTEWHRSLEKS